MSAEMEPWMDEFNRLKKLNGEMLAGKVSRKKPAKPKSSELTQPKPPR
jgi:hypothetical protein